MTMHELLFYAALVVAVRWGYVWGKASASKE